MSDRGGRGRGRGRGGRGSADGFGGRSGDAGGDRDRPRDGGRGRGGRSDGGRGGGGRTDGRRDGGGRDFSSSGGGRSSGGYSGRSFGGGGRGPSTVVKWITVMPPPIIQDGNLKAKYQSGWNDFSDDSGLQTYRGPLATSYKEKVKVSVNHFPISKFQLPTKIYHYEVTFERIREQKDAKGKKGDDSGSKVSPVKKKSKGDGGGGDGPSQQGPKKLPKPLPQLILSYLLKKIYDENKFWGIVSDLSNNIYSTKPLENLGIDMNPVVSLKDVDQDILQENDDGKIQVKIIRSEHNLDSQALQALNAHLRSNGTWRGFEIDPTIKTVVEQVLNAVVKAFPTYKFLPLGRSNLIKWPTTTADVMPLGSNVICWKGVSAHVGMGWKPYLNVDVAHCAFLEDKEVLKLCDEILGGDASDIRNWRPWAFAEAKSLLKNVKVFYCPAPGKKLAGPITDILRTSVSETFFEFGGQKISVYEYFVRQYSKRVKPNGPCLILRNRCQVPAELCTIKKGQSYNRKLNEMQTREMLKCAKKDPHVLHREITQQMSSLETSSPITQEWGLEISNQMLTFDETRVLHAPQLIYGIGTNDNEGKGRAGIVPGDGSWDINTTSFHFLTIKQISSWGILVAGNCRLNQRSLEAFEEKVVQCGKNKGLNFGEKAILVLAPQLEERKDDQVVARNNVTKLKEIFAQNFMKKDNPPCQIVFVVVPRKNSPLYCHVKQAAEIHVGILTQCIVSANVDKCQPATIQNILLKVNSKLDGRNYIVTPPLPKPEFVDIVNCPMLIIGADVTHPPPGSTRKIQIGKQEKEVAVPSFAAVTGSIDRTGMPFMMDIRAQVKAGKGAAEVIQNFDSIVLNMLIQFEQKTKSPRTPNGIRPRKIIYYRDGVGEGQFPEVLHVEMNAIRNACMKLKDYDGEPYEPKITFVTVQKRHKTRFFCHTAQGIVNAPAGTVVDQEIVHPTQTDFFLQSHKGMMGTSRPTRYRVLWDDTGFTADQIQNLTYFLCYMYIRCSKSVRIPAPTYYAHWAAARAKALTDGMEEYYDDIQKLNEKIKRHANILNNFPMHFV